VPKAFVQIDDKNLGTFSPDTPKLPIGSSFEANLRPEGSSVVLKVNPDSIQLPEPVLPGAESAQSSELDREQWRREMFAGLVTAVATTYEQRRSGDAEIAQFKVGDKWTAYVQPTGDFIIRNEVRRTICRGNLHTSEETVPLSEECAGELERMLVERERSPQPEKPRSPYSTNPQFSFDCD
jgi:hypothetical protein